MRSHSSTHHTGHIWIALPDPSGQKLGEEHAFPRIVCIRHLSNNNVKDVHYRWTTERIVEWEVAGRFSTQPCSGIRNWQTGSIKTNEQKWITGPLHCLFLSVCPSVLNCRMSIHLATLYCAVCLTLCALYGSTHRTFVHVLVHVVSGTRFLSPDPLQLRWHCQDTATASVTIAN